MVGARLAVATVASATSEKANSVRLRSVTWVRRWAGYHEVQLCGWEICACRIEGGSWWHWRVIDERSRDWWKTQRIGTASTLGSARAEAEQALSQMYTAVEKLHFAHGN